MVKLRISRLFQDFSQFMTFEATRCKPHWVVRFVNNFFMNFSLSFCKKFSKRSEGGGAGISDLVVRTTRNYHIFLASFLVCE